MDALLGPVAAGWQLRFAESGLLLAALPPGAFIIAGLLLAAVNAGRRRRAAARPLPQDNEAT